MLILEVGAIAMALVFIFAQVVFGVDGEFRDTILLCFVFANYVAISSIRDGDKR